MYTFYRASLPLIIFSISVQARNVKRNYNHVASNESDDDDEAEGWVISSESCGFLSIGARYVREVFPGEIVELTREGIKTIEIVERPNKRPQAFCIFEYVYFARSDSIFEGKHVMAIGANDGQVSASSRAHSADYLCCTCRANGLFRAYAMRTSTCDGVTG